MKSRRKSPKLIVGDEIPKKYEQKTSNINKTSNISETSTSETSNMNLKYKLAKAQRPSYNKIVFGR